MLSALEKYRFAGDLHRQALHQLPQTADLTMQEKKALRGAARLGWWLGIGVQMPVVFGSMWLLEKKVKKLPTDRMFVVYMIGLWGYGMYYMLSKAWAWHYAFSTVEPIVKEYVLTADIEEIRRLQQEQSLGIAASTDKLYLPKE